MAKVILFALIGSAAIFFGTIELIHGQFPLGFVLCVGGFLIVHSNDAAWAHLGLANSRVFDFLRGRRASSSADLVEENTMPPSRNRVRPLNVLVSVSSVIVAGAMVVVANPAELARVAFVAGGVIFAQALLLTARSFAEAQRVRR